MNHDDVGAGFLIDANAVVGCKFHQFMFRC